jgi:molybdate transport system substrate-binding protein
MDFAVIAVLKRRIVAGETFDVVIPSPELIDELVGQGKVAADTRAPFGKAGVGLGVRKGAPRPDISTPENLKRALLAAKAVGHSREGQSGVAFVEALKRSASRRRCGPGSGPTSCRTRRSLCRMAKSTSPRAGWGR